MAFFCSQNISVFRDKIDSAASPDNIAKAYFALYLNQFGDSHLYSWTGLRKPFLTM